MDIWDICYEILRKRWQSGITQQEIAKKANLSRAHITHILNGNRQIQDLSVQHFLNLFPEMVVVQKKSLSSLKQPSQLTPAEEKLLFLFRSMPESRQLDLLIELARETKPEEEKSKVG